VLSGIGDFLSGRARRLQLLACIVVILNRLLGSTSDREYMTGYTMIVMGEGSTFLFGGIPSSVYNKQLLKTLFDQNVAAMIPLDCTLDSIPLT
jgi:hypothetical protein